MHRNLLKSTPVFSVSVLGLPSCEAALLSDEAVVPNQLQRHGVGKSSLCRRFALPSFDDYNSCPVSSRTAISGDEFLHDREINGVHYLYYGKAVRMYDEKFVEFHVVEHTTMVDCETGEKHQSGAEFSYVERAVTGCLRRPAKVACVRREDQCETQNFPDNAFADGADGYLFVVDCTSSDAVLRRQVDMLDEVSRKCREAGARPLAVAFTKADVLSAQRIRSVHQSPNYKHVLERLPCFEMSAETGFGVDVAFLHLFALRSQAAPETVPRPTQYNTLATINRQAEERAWSEFRQLLAKEATEFSATWSGVVVSAGRSPTMAALTHFCGRAAMREYFRLHLVQLMAAKMRIAFRQALKEHPDFDDGDHCAEMYER